MKKPVLTIPQLMECTDKELGSMVRDFYIEHQYQSYNNGVYDTSMKLAESHGKVIRLRTEDSEL